MDETIVENKEQEKTSTEPFARVFFRHYDRKIASGEITFKGLHMDANHFTNMCTDGSFVPPLEAVEHLARAMKLTNEEAEYFIQNAIENGSEREGRGPRKGETMFRELRRPKQALSEAECRQILEKGSFGVLAVDGDDNYPYTVPLSYHCEGDDILFHCGKAGHKIDAIERNDKVTFCVVGQDLVVPEKYTTYFKSVICFGRIEKIEDDAEKYATVEKLALKYHPDDTEENRKYEIEKDFAPLQMLRLKVEHMTGKQSIYLAKEANK